MKPKVSIIIPIYNVEGYLPKCLDNLLNQTFKDIEILAISDGTPDNSVNIVKQYCKKDKRIKCIEKENGGYGSVLEYAIKNIKTEYFIICDPDDWLRNDAIEILYNAAKENDLDFVRGGFYYVYSNDMSEEYCNGNIYPKIFNPESKKIYTSDLEKFLFSTVSPHAKLYRTKLAKNIEFPHKVSFTDILLFMIYILNVKKAMFIDEGLSYYLYDRTGNTVTDAKPKIADDHYIVTKSIIDQYEKSNKKSNYFYYRVLLQWLHINGEIGKIKNKSDFLEKRELIYKLLLILVDHRKEIYPFLKYHSFKEKISYRTLLNKNLCRKMFEYHSNKAWKYHHGKK